MPAIKDKLIVALDVENFEKAKYFVDLLYPQVKIFKVGAVLFTACGKEVVQMIQAKGAQVFLDLKYHDIPNTVKKSVQAAATLKVDMLTVHLSGGREMLEAAASVPGRPKILGVTILTSKNEKDTKEKVLDLAKLAQEAGLDGVVCSVSEAQEVRRQCGQDFIVVTPGIRPKDYQSDDQARVATAQDAITAGADYIVVGRPILEARDPQAALKDILKESS